MERVADYPRPPRLEPARRRVRVVLGGETIVDTQDAWRVLETHHPPTYYVPPDAFPPGTLLPSPGRGSVCEWKGRASYLTLRAGAATAPDAAWCYPEPTPAFRPIAGFVALYPGRMDACWVDDDRVAPQPGGFYGGWITPDLVGPFKGGPGTLGW